MIDPVVDAKPGDSLAPESALGDGDGEAGLELGLDLRFNPGVLSSSLYLFPIRLEKFRLDIEWEIEFVVFER